VITFFLDAGHAAVVALDGHADVFVWILAAFFEFWNADAEYLCVAVESAFDLEFELSVFPVVERLLADEVHLGGADVVGFELVVVFDVTAGFAALEFDQLVVRDGPHHELLHFSPLLLDDSAWLVVVDTHPHFGALPVFERALGLDFVVYPEVHFLFFAVHYHLDAVVQREGFGHALHGHILFVELARAVTDSNHVLVPLHVSVHVAQSDVFLLDWVAHDGEDQAWTASESVDSEI